MKAEDAGGPNGLVKDTLAGGQLGLELREATLQIGLLDRMIPLIRAEPTQSGKLDASGLVVDMLKWKILDAGSWGRFRRTLARLLAKADPEYHRPVPPEIH